MAHDYREVVQRRERDQHQGGEGEKGEEREPHVSQQGVDGPERRVMLRLAA